MSERPPTQIASVQGFSAFEAKPSRPQERIDWRRLIAFPPFQMFAAEKMPHEWARINSELHAAEFLRTLSSDEKVALFDEYCQWHADKRHWKNETPLGELLA